MAHNRLHGAGKAQEFARQGVFHDLRVSARIADWIYRETSELNGVTWVKGKTVELLPTDWRRGLAVLLN